MGKADLAVKYIQNAIDKAKAIRSLNALITETFDLAQSQCENAVLKGIEPFSIVVKDCFAIKDIPMTCASKMLCNYVAPYTATPVQKLLDNGGCLIGKANMDEFAMGSTSAHSHFGPVKHISHFTSNNKLTQESSDWRVAGGSSGGCGVAVALGIARIALGSDTGGSTRNPAAFNGVFGFKPSYGTLSRHGLVPLANSFDVPSIIANSAQDCRYFFDVMRGVDIMDSTSIEIPSSMQKLKKKKFRIGLPKEYRIELLSKDAEEAWDFAAETLRSIGLDVFEVSLPFTKFSIVCYHVLSESDIASNMARYDGVRYGFRQEDSKKIHSFDEMLTENRSEALNNVVKRRIIAGNFYNLKENHVKYFQKAAKIRRLIKNDFDAVFCNVDAILTPTTSHSAPLYSEIQSENFRDRQRRDDFFTQPANMAGLPAISVPITKCVDGYPLGVQFVSNYLNDSCCLYLAELLHSNLSK